MPTRPMLYTSILATVAVMSLSVADALATERAAPTFMRGPYAAMMVVPAVPEQVSVARAQTSAGLVTIFSSLASKYPKGVYWCCTGYNVMGSNSGVGVQWMAGAFTPAADHTVSEIEVAVGYSGQGTNGVVISLNEDKNGIPGKALKSWSATNLPTFGTCCGTVIKKDKSGIAVTGGKQYWVVLSTNGNETATVDGWNVSDADQVDQANFASWDGSIWHTFQTAPGLAFAVRGN